MFPEWFTREPISTSSDCVWSGVPIHITWDRDLWFLQKLTCQRGRGWVYIVVIIYWSSPRSMPVFLPSLSPLPNDTTLKKWKGKSSLKLFLFLFWLQSNTPKLCFRISVIPSIIKANHLLLLIVRRGAETKQETDPDSPICFACMEFDFKNLPQITLKGWKMLWFLQQLRSFIIGFTSSSYFWVRGNVETKRSFKGQWYVLISLILWKFWAPGHFSSVLESPHIC